MESSKALLRLEGLLTTLILISTLGKVADSKAANVVAVRSQPSCINEIHEGIRNQPNGGYGGYGAIEYPLDDAVVNDIVISAVRLYKQRTNDLKQFTYFENSEQVEAYKQYVNGVNYCVQFTFVSVNCSGNGDCSNEKRITCSLSAHKAFKEKEARINAETLKCAAVA